MTGIGVGLLRLLHALLPLPWLARLGEHFGALLGRLSRRRRAVVETNLRLCFPQWGDAEREAVMRRHFRALGRASLLEAISWWGSREEVERTVRIEGAENVTAIAGRPVILLAPHFLGLNLGGVRVSLMLAPCVSIYARIKNPVLDRLMLHARTRFGASELYSRHDGIKPVLRALKKGLPLYYLPDLDYGRKESIFVPFFGVRTATISGLPRMAHAAHALVVPCVTRWDGHGYVTRYYPALENYPSGDLAADVARMNAFIEERIREMPEQYFWVHKRFKTRPEGERPVYED